jgi:hypothetical protein
MRAPTAPRWFSSFRCQQRWSRDSCPQRHAACKVAPRSRTRRVAAVASPRRLQVQAFRLARVAPLLGRSGSTRDVFPGLSARPSCRVHVGVSAGTRRAAKARHAARMVSAWAGTRPTVLFSVQADRTAIGPGTVAPLPTVAQPFAPDAAETAKPPPQTREAPSDGIRWGLEAVRHPIVRTVAGWPTNVATRLVAASRGFSANEGRVVT